MDRGANLGRGPVTKRVQQDPDLQQPDLQIAVGSVGETVGETLESPGPSAP